MIKNAIAGFKAATVRNVVNFLKPDFSSCFPHLQSQRCARPRAPKHQNKLMGVQTPCIKRQKKLLSNPAVTQVASGFSAFSGRPHNTAGVRPTFFPHVPPSPVCRMQTPRILIHGKHDFHLRASTAQPSSTHALRKTAPLLCAWSRAHPLVTITPQAHPKVADDETEVF